MQHRPDIDGLRAWAVVPVVLFHAGIAPFGGGYLGVDVFFVISGYLITSVIANDIRRGQFSIIRFYERRIRRIFPALFLVLAASFVAAFLLLLPEAFESFSKALVAATLFLSNVLFDTWFGYFAIPAERSPLLHTWSLAIEEQFYVVFPVFLLVAVRLLKGRILWAIVPVLLASLAFALASELWRPNRAFFLLPARIWELALGAALAHEAIRPPSRPLLRDLLSFAGLGLIAWSVLAPPTSYPGFNAVLPCLGAGLVIWSGKDGAGALARRVLGNPLAVFVGLISYSLYLWHWPLLVFARARALGELTSLETAAVLALTLVASVLSWRFVERPFRGKGALLSRRQVFLCAAAAMSVATALGVIGVVTKGWPSRLPNYDADFHIPGRETYNEGSCFLRNEQTYDDWQGDACFLTRGKSQVLLLWGDSLAAHYAPGLTAQGGLLGYDVLQYTKSGCRPFLAPVEGNPWDCPAINGNAERVIEDYGVDAVLLAGRWMAEAGRLDQLTATVRWLTDRGLRVFVIGQTPVFPFDNAYDAAYTTGRSDGELGFDPALNDALRKVAEGAVFIDPTEALCSGGRCIFEDEGGFLYWEGSHLSAHGSDVVVRHMLPLLQ